MTQITRPGHKRTEYQTPQSQKTAEPSIQSKKIQEPTEPTLLQKICRIFCCCCSKPEQRAEVEPITQVEKFEFDDLLFDVEGEGDQRHYVIKSSTSQLSLTEPQEGPEETLYSKLNQLDYTAVRKVIEANRNLLPEEKRIKLLAVLEEMQKSQPFLNPTYLAQKISNLPENLLGEIREQASLAAINADGRKLDSINISPSADPLKNLLIALDICYIFPSRDEFNRQTGRYPRNVQEKADCIRWGALHRYSPYFIPESISKLKHEVEETVLDHKSSTTEELSPTSISCPSGFEKDSSLETLPEDSLDTQFKQTATTSASLRDVS